MTVKFSPYALLLMSFISIVANSWLGQATYSDLELLARLDRKFFYAGEP